MTSTASEDYTDDKRALACAWVNSVVQGSYSTLDRIPALVACQLLEVLHRTEINLADEDIFFGDQEELPADELLANVVCAIKLATTVSGFTWCEADVSEQLAKQPSVLPDDFWLWFVQYAQGMEEKVSFEGCDFSSHRWHCNLCRRTEPLYEPVISSTEEHKQVSKSRSSGMSKLATLRQVPPVDAAEVRLWKKAQNETRPVILETDKYSKQLLVVSHSDAILVFQSELSGSSTAAGAEQPEGPCEAPLPMLVEWKSTVEDHGQSMQTSRSPAPPISMQLDIADDIPPEVLTVMASSTSRLTAREEIIVQAKGRDVAIRAVACDGRSKLTLMGSDEELLLRATYLCALASTCVDDVRGNDDGTVEGEESTDPAAGRGGRTSSLMSVNRSSRSQSIQGGSFAGLESCPCLDPDCGTKEITAFFAHYAALLRGGELRPLPSSGMFLLTATLPPSTSTTASGPEEEQYTILVMTRGMFYHSTRTARTSHENHSGSSAQLSDLGRELLESVVRLISNGVCVILTGFQDLGDLAVQFAASVISRCPNAPKNRLLFVITFDAGVINALSHSFTIPDRCMPCNLAEYYYIFYNVSWSGSVSSASRTATDVANEELFYQLGTQLFINKKQRISAMHSLPWEEVTTRERCIACVSASVTANSLASQPTLYHLAFLRCFMSDSAAFALLQCTATVAPRSGLPSPGGVLPRLRTVKDDPLSFVIEIHGTNMMLLSPEAMEKATHDESNDHHLVVEDKQQVRTSFSVLQIRCTLVELLPCWSHWRRSHHPHKDALMTTPQAREYFDVRVPIVSVHERQFVSVKVPCSLPSPYGFPFSLPIESEADHAPVSAVIHNALLLSRLHRRSLARKQRKSSLRGVSLVEASKRSFPFLLVQLLSYAEIIAGVISKSFAASSSFSIGWLVGVTTENRKLPNGIEVTTTYSNFLEEEDTQGNEGENTVENDSILSDGWKETDPSEQASVTKCIVDAVTATHFHSYDESLDGVIDWLGLDRIGQLREHSCYAKESAIYHAVMAATRTTRIVADGTDGAKMDNFTPVTDVLPFGRFVAELEAYMVGKDPPDDGPVHIRVRDNKLFCLCWLILVLHSMRLGLRHAVAVGVFGEPEAGTTAVASALDGCVMHVSNSIVESSGVVAAHHQDPNATAGDINIPAPYHIVVVDCGTLVRKASTAGAVLTEQQFKSFSHIPRAVAAVAQEHPVADSSTSGLMSVDRAEASAVASAPVTAVESEQAQEKHTTGQLLVGLQRVCVLDGEEHAAGEPSAASSRLSEVFGSLSTQCEAWDAADINRNMCAVVINKMDLVDAGERAGVIKDVANATARNPAVGRSAVIRLASATKNTGGRGATDKVSTCGMRDVVLQGDELARDVLGVVERLLW